MFDFCLIVNESQAELDWQCEFPMISFLTSFNLIWTVGKKKAEWEEHTLLGKPAVRTGVTGFLRRTRAVLRNCVRSELLAKQTFCVFSSLILWRCRGLFCFSKWDANVPLLSLPKKLRFTLMPLSAWRSPRQGGGQSLDSAKRRNKHLYLKKKPQTNPTISKPMHWWCGSKEN